MPFLLKLEGKASAGEAAALKWAQRRESSVDGRGWLRAAGLLGGLVEDHSLPSRGWKCPQRELAVRDVNSPVGFRVTAVNSFIAP